MDIHTTHSKHQPPPKNTVCSNEHCRHENKTICEDDEYWVCPSKCTDKEYYHTYCKERELFPEEVEYNTKHKIC